MHDPAGAVSACRGRRSNSWPASCTICPRSAPSPRRRTVSYFRLRPNRWAPTYAYLGAAGPRRRLAHLPGLTRPGADAANQFNVEYRPADAAASPYLALGAIVWAGVDGIRSADLPEPRDVSA